MLNIPSLTKVLQCECMGLGLGSQVPELIFREDSVRDFLRNSIYTSERSYLYIRKIHAGVAPPLLVGHFCHCWTATSAFLDSEKSATVYLHVFSKTWWKIPGDYMYAPGGNKVQNLLFASRSKSRSLTLISYGRASLVEYACQIWSL